MLKTELIGFSFDRCWLVDIFKPKNYENLCQKYQTLLKTITLQKNDKNETLKYFVESSKLENILINAENNQFNPENKYFGKIKINFGETKEEIILNLLLLFKENENEADLRIDFLMKQKDFEKYSEAQEKIISILQKELKNIIFKNYFNSS